MLYTARDLVTRISSLIQKNRYMSIHRSAHELIYVDLKGFSGSRNGLLIKIAEMFSETLGEDYTVITFCIANV